MLRHPSELLREQARSLQHLDSAIALAEYLAAERQQCLESLSKATDEVTFRRLQGAVFVLGDVLDLLKPRTP